MYAKPRGLCPSKRFQCNPDMWKAAGHFPQVRVSLCPPFCICSPPSALLSSSACSPLLALLRLLCSPPPALPRLLSTACSPPPALLRLLSSACSPLPALVHLLSPTCSPSPALLHLLSPACSPPPALLRLLSSTRSPQLALLRLLSCSPPPTPALPRLLSSTYSPPPALLLSSTYSPPPALVGKSHSGRCGWWQSNAPLLTQPDWSHYSLLQSVVAGELHSEQMLRVLDPDGSLNSATMLYPSGPRGRAMRGLPSYAAKLDGGSHKRLAPIDEGDTSKGYDDADPRRLCYGQPRHCKLLPGRAFWRLSKSQNRKLQSYQGPSLRLNLVMAHSGFRSILLMMALLGAKSLSDLPDGSSSPLQHLLGTALRASAAYTWQVFQMSPSFEAALRSLAACKGFYVNYYPAAFHADADEFFETWLLRQTLESRARAKDRRPPPTVVPQLGIALTAEPNGGTVWTAGLQKTLHATAEVEGLTPEERAHLGRGACDAFHLQSRGSSDVWQEVL